MPMLASDVTSRGIKKVRFPVIDLFLLHAIKIGRKYV